MEYYPKTRKHQIPINNIDLFTSPYSNHEKIIELSLSIF